MRISNVPVVLLFLAPMTIAYPLLNAPPQKRSSYSVVAVDGSSASTTSGAVTETQTVVQSSESIKTITASEPSSTTATMILVSTAIITESASLPTSTTSAAAEATSSTAESETTFSTDTTMYTTYPGLTSLAITTTTIPSASSALSTAESETTFSTDTTMYTTYPGLTSLATTTSTSIASSTPSPTSTNIATIQTVPPSPTSSISASNPTTYEYGLWRASYPLFNLTSTPTTASPISSAIAKRQWSTAVPNLPKLPKLPAGGDASWNETEVPQVEVVQEHTVPGL